MTITIEWLLERAYNEPGLFIILTNSQLRDCLEQRFYLGATTRYQTVVYEFLTDFLFLVLHQLFR